MTDIEMLAQKAGIKAARAEAGFYEKPGIDEIRHSVDHTLLSSSSTEGDIKKLCDEAQTYGFAAVCVPPLWVPYARNCLEGKSQKVVAAIAFPLGTLPVEVKVNEIEWALKNGAEEFDVVATISDIIDEDRQAVREEFRALREVTSGRCLKIIIETPLLNDRQKFLCVNIAEQTGVDYLKTGTGFAGPVTFYDVAFLRTVASDSLHVKASGGIRTLVSAGILRALGADRLGASQSTNFLPLPE
ncbi:MAG: deoxyribose-phosphate aldolase, partial [Thermovirgaceae bacterium]